jgi:hypothetical protein
MLSVDYRCAFWSVKASETLRILQSFRPMDGHR